MNRITETVKHLIIINVLLYLATKFAYPPLQDLFALHFPKNPNFGFWQYVTSMFMHSLQSPTHLIFNMVGVWMFGSPLEQLWGRNKFLFFYFSAGIGAGLVYTAVNYFQFNSAVEYLINIGVSHSEINQIVNIRNVNYGVFVQKVNAILTSNTNIEETTKVFVENIIEINQKFNTPAVGASGALYGILVAFGMKFPNSKLALIFFPVPVAAKYFIPALIALDLFSGLTGFSLFGGGIAHFAHVGGAVVGLIIMLFWKNNQFNRWDK
ncbi:MAG TPA: rhomboid family intramembrane serine protease [Flavobacteriaceae bacterium]|jgi:membrane associated rhomboid family serine protease|nr:rhomboid family intramembrane serine protease [Flavobacteriaceae bacterium]HBS11288.1 rhomboid family intramembrane serine protease [Flavobacteriaceae bacterium]